MKDIVYKKATELTKFSRLLFKLERLSVYQSSLTGDYIIKSPHFRGKDAYISSWQRVLEFTILKNHNIMCTYNYCVDHSATSKLSRSLGEVILYYLASKCTSETDRGKYIGIIDNVENCKLKLGITIVNSWGILYTVYVNNETKKYEDKFLCFVYKNQFMVNEEVDDYFKSHKRHNSAIANKLEITYSLV